MPPPLLHIGNHHLHLPLTTLTLPRLHPPPAPLHLFLPPSCSSVNSAHSSASRSSGGGGSVGIGGGGGGSQPHSPTSSSSSSSYRYRSSLPHQPPPPGGIAAHRLSSVSSHDSGFVSQDANIYSKPPSPMPSDITSQVQKSHTQTDPHVSVVKSLKMLVMLVSSHATELAWTSQHLMYLLWKWTRIILWTLCWPHWDCSLVLEKKKKKKKIKL